jgi:hypothetical protein
VIGVSVEFVEPQVPLPEALHQALGVGHAHT